MISKPILDLTVKSFQKQADFRTWLMKNHATEPGIWLQLFKKNSGVTSINYAQALDEALCFGWIDGQVKKFDELSWVQRFTPRRPKGIWSKRNREHVARLIAAGQMQPAGLKEVESAKADGRWDQAYDSPANMKVPEDFLKEVAKNKKAAAFFKTLNKMNTYTIGWRLQTARKPETRKKRMDAILAMLAKGEKFY